MPARTAFVLVFLFFGGLAVAAEPTKAARPNIVLFVVDDLGVMDTSVPFLTDADGRPKRYPLNDFYRTPHLEELAAAGTRFETFYAMSVCSPTRVSLMTGQTSARHHTTQWIKEELNNRGEFGPPAWRWEGIAPADVTLPELLNDAGYRTIFVGKAHFGPDDVYAELPQNFGFDVNIAGNGHGQPGSYLGLENFGNPDHRRAVPDLEKYHGEDLFLTEALTREVNTEIADAVAADEPFFAMMAHYAVHSPFTVDDDYAAGYDAKGNKLAYATMVEGVDASLGAMLEHLRDLGVAENTLILFLGDNGGDAPIGRNPHAIAPAAPLRGKKATHYEGGMRTPLVAAWAEPADNAVQTRLPIVQGVVQTQMADVNDLFPTILNLAEVDAPADHVSDGEDLAPLLAGPAAGPQQGTFLMHFPHEHRTSYFTVYRDGDWKVIYHYFPEGEADPPRETKPYNSARFPRYELFDLAADPFETNNLAGERPDELRKMMTGLVDALEAAGAQYPTVAGREIGPVVPGDETL